MQAIITRYVPATAHRPPRIVAACLSGRLTINYPDDVDDFQTAHRVAALALVDAMGWQQHGDLLGGSLPHGGCCFVFDNNHARL
jgi:hypothetical protein